MAIIDDRNIQRITTAILALDSLIFADLTQMKFYHNLIRTLDQ